MYHLGVDIGGTNLKFGLLDNRFELIEDHSVKMPKTSDLNAIKNILINEIVKIATNYKLSSIGIGVPGIIDNQGLIVVSPNIPAFNGFNFLEFLKHSIPQKIGREIPIKLENDANIAAIAEMTLGSGAEYDSFVYITLGTGVGGAIILNRELFRGNHGSAGEIGHMIFNSFAKPKRREYRTGVLEEYLGKKAIISYAKRIAHKHPNSVLTKEKKFDIITISDYADKGDELAIVCMERIGFYLGITIISIANLLDINHFIIGGGISKSSEYFYSKAMEIANKRALPHLQGIIKIEKAKFSSKAGIIGSAIYGAIK